MPSRRSKRRLDRLLKGCVGALVAFVAACGPPAQRPETGPRPPSLAEPLLVAPTTGYGEPLDPELAHLVDRAHASLIRGGPPAEALAKAEALARRPSMVAPAAVLAAQAHFVAGDFELALETVAPVAEERPDYVAAWTVYGRSAERLDRLPVAAWAYGTVADASPLARARLRRIEGEALDRALDEIRDALADGDVDVGRRRLERFQTWAPRDDDTLAVVSELAAVLGDSQLELDLVRRLVAAGRDDRQLRERLATLELEVGDAGRGLEILEEMQREWPDDAEIAGRLQQAQFAWRLQMLPEAARSLDHASPLDRGQLAVLVYWVFPSVRYQRAAEAVIANDVLDHAHRSEIVRVVNLGLMDIDPNLHAFRPGREAKRLDGLTAMLRVLEKSRSGESCLDGATPDREMTAESICSLAHGCGLLPEVGDCLPGSPLTGREAMELARRATRQLEQG